MERLTERWNDSVVKLKGCSNVYVNVERKRAHIQNAIVRLAAYEDSGLMPDEVEKIIRCQDCKYFLTAFDVIEGITINSACNNTAGLRYPEEDRFCSYGEKKEE